MSKTILLTGANGQLGRSIYLELSPFYNVVPAIYKNISNPSLFNNNEIKLDITNKSELKYIYDEINPNIIINTAAFTDVNCCEVEKEKAVDINVNGVKNLLSVMKNETLFIQISTDYVFDGVSGWYTENNPTYPKTYYGKTKLEAENILRGSNKQYLILRPNVLFGNDINSSASFVSWVFQNLRKQNKINVVIDQISNPTWTTAFSQAIRQCIIMKARGIYHYGSDDLISRFDFAKLIAEIFDFDSSLIHPIKSENLNQIPARPKKTNLDVSKIANEIGAHIYTLDYSLNQLKRLINE